MILVSRAAFDEAALSRLDRLARQMGVQVVRSPRRPDRTDLEAIISAPLAATLQRLYSSRGLLLDAVQDDRPFGHNHLALADAAFGHHRERRGELALQSADTKILLGIVGALGLLLAALLATLVRRAPRDERSGTLHSLAVFALLGLGFMLLEIVLVEHASLLLGHPTVALVTVLTSMLLALCAGSLWSERLGAEQRPARRLAVAAVAALAVVLLPGLVPGLMPLLRDTVPSWARPVIVGALLLVGASPLGVLLPTALRVVSKQPSGSAPAAWSVNAVASVLGTVAAALLVRSVGFRATAEVAAVAYAAALGSWLALDWGRAPPAEVAR